MSAKFDRSTSRRAQQLARELHNAARAPGLLGRLCRWETARRHGEVFTLKNRRD